MKKKGSIEIEYDDETDFVQFRAWTTEQLPDEHPIMRMIHTCEAALVDHIESKDKLN